MSSYSLPNRSCQIPCELALSQRLELVHAHRPLPQLRKGVVTGALGKQEFAATLLALFDSKSLVNGLEPVGDMPMSLLAYTAWTSPYVWTRTAHCSATFSATLSSLASVVPTQAEGSTVADVPSSSVAYTRFCDDHVLDNGACQKSSSSCSEISET